MLFVVLMYLHLFLLLFLLCFLPCYPSIKIREVSLSYPNNLSISLCVAFFCVDWLLLPIKLKRIFITSTYVSSFKSTIVKPILKHDATNSCSGNTSLVVLSLLIFPSSFDNSSSTKAIYGKFRYL